jgi:hypothetical protein
MMNHDLLQLKLLRRGLCDQSQLMLGHFPVCFVFYPFDLSPVFNPANNASKIDDRAGGRIAIILWRFKQRLCQ